MGSKIINKVDFLEFDKKYKTLLKSNVPLIDKAISYLCKKVNLLGPH